VKAVRENGLATVPTTRKDTRWEAKKISAKNSASGKKQMRGGAANQPEKNKREGPAWQPRGQKKKEKQKGASRSCAQRGTKMFAIPPAEGQTIGTRLQRKRNQQSLREGKKES